MSQCYETADSRRDRRQSAAFSPIISPHRPRGHDPRSRRAPAPKSSRSTPEDTKYRRRRNSRGSQAMRATVPSSSRDEIDGIIVTLPNFGDERGIADTLRAMADLNVPVLMQATPDTPSANDHSRPPRQLLRQDVGLQQPDAVRHSLLADDAAHRSAATPSCSRRISHWFARRLPRRERAARTAHRRDRRASRGIQHGSLQREAAGSESASRSSPSIFRRFSAASIA